MPQPSDCNSIADRSWDVRQSLLDLLDNARTSEVPIGPQEIEDVLDRFKLWTGNLGALHQAHTSISLESRLADSPEVQGQICEQLDDMQEAIQDLRTLCSETCKDLASNIKDEQEDPRSIGLMTDDFVLNTENTSIDEEASLMLSMVCQCLKALFRIGILVRKATPRDGFERMLQQSEFPFTPQFDINYVKERHPKLASKDSRWLASRLGRANAKRRQYINHVRDCKDKVQAKDMNPTTDAATTQQLSEATTGDVSLNPSGSELLHSSSEVEDDSVSLVSAPTAFDNDNSLRLPSLADLGPDGKYFKCPICFTMQSFHNEKSWKIHAYRDLKAYVCTSGRQECEGKMFGDRDSWFSHELKHHYSLYMCKICGSQYMDTKVLQQHLLDEHGPYSNEEILLLIGHGKLVPSQLKAQDCPFCDDWASILSRSRHQLQGQTASTNHQNGIEVPLTQFKRHVATHLEQLAIFSVPKATDDEDRSHEAAGPKSGAISSKDENSQIFDKEAPPFKDSNAYKLSTTRIHVSGLPRNVSSADIRAMFNLIGSKGITEIKLMNGFGFIEYTNHWDALTVISTFNKSILMGEPIKVQFARLFRDDETGEMHVLEDPYADNFDVARAIRQINDAYSQYKADVIPLCEEFITRPPSDPQERQDQYDKLNSMVMNVLRRVNTTEPKHEEEVSAKRNEVIRPVGEMLNRICAVAMRNSRDAEVKTKYDSEDNVRRDPTVGFRVKLYKLRDSDWVDHGTGLCTAEFVETADDSREVRIVVESEGTPKDVLLEAQVHKDDAFQKQQDALIVWTENQTRSSTALTFDTPRGRDTIWTIVNNFHRRDVGELGAPD